MHDIHSSSIRRGALALINIAAPATVGVVTGQSREVLLATVGGILFSFADNDGALLARLRLLAMVGGALALGGLLGYVAGEHPVVLWLLFPPIVFAVGLLNRGGREPVMAGRFGAMAFAVVAEIPAIHIAEIAYLVGVLVLAALARSLDHLLFGPMVRAAPGPPAQKPEGHWGWARFAATYAGAAALALLIGTRLDPGRAVWIVTTTLVVMQPDARSSYRRIVQRILGTFLGVLGAFALTSGLHSPLLLCVAIAALAAYLPHHVPHRYWLHTALIAMLVLLVYDLVALDASSMIGLYIERVQDMLVGCAIALVGTAIAFPRRDGADEEKPDRDDVP